MCSEGCIDSISCWLLFDWTNFEKITSRAASAATSGGGVNF